MAANRYGISDSDITRGASQKEELKAEQTFLDAKRNLIFQDQKKINDFITKLSKQREQELQKLKEENLEAYEALLKETTEKAEKLTAVYYENIYKNSTKEQKQQLDQQQASLASNLQKQLAQKAVLTKEERKQQEEALKVQQQSEEKLLKSVGGAKKKQLTLEAKERNDQLQLEYKAQIEVLERLKQQREESGEEFTEDEAESLKSARDALKSVQSYGSGIASDKKYLETQEKLYTAVMQFGNKLTSAIDNAISTYTQYQARVEARLQGSNENWADLSEKIRTVVGFSGIVSQKKMLEHVSTLVDKGIAYNVEQRAFLETISENIATTFSATNDTLLRLVRLQQKDSTAARLGMEAFLTRALNKWYDDTSYLTDTFDSVSSAMLEASSTMTREQAVEFEYIVQKWLGSLGSLGVGSDILTSIAQGINYLQTGNISGLNSNESLQRLIVSGMNQAGLEYGTILNQGMSLQDTNSLLQGIIEYVQELVKTSNSNVVTQQLASLFGLSVADINAIGRITKTELNNIANTNLNYYQAVSETENQITQVSSRIPLQQRMQTVLENITTSIGTNIGNNPALYAMWAINNVIEDATGGINIPFISALGNGIDLNANLNQLMKLGIAGAGTLSYIGELISSGTNPFNGVSLAEWGEEVRLARGGAADIRATGVQNTTSYSSYAANSASGDIQSATLAGAREESERQLSEEKEKSKSIEDIYNGLFGSDQQAIAVVAYADSDRTINAIDRITTAFLDEQGVQKVEVVNTSDRPVITKTSEISSTIMDVLVQKLTDKLSAAIISSVLGTNNGNEDTAGGLSVPEMLVEIQQALTQTIPETVDNISRAVDIIKNGAM